MFEVISAERKGNKEIVEVVDSVSGKGLRFSFPKNIYSEKLLIEKIKRAEKTGITSKKEEEDSLAKNLVGKKLNRSKGVFE